MPGLEKVRDGPGTTLAGSAADNDERNAGAQDTMLEEEMEDLDGAEASAAPLVEPAQPTAMTAGTASAATTGLEAAGAGAGADGMSSTEFPPRPEGQSEGRAEPGDEKSCALEAGLGCECLPNEEATMSAAAVAVSLLFVLSSPYMRHLVTPAGLALLGQHSCEGKRPDKNQKNRYAPSSSRVCERFECMQGTKIPRISIRNAFRGARKRLYPRSFFL